MRLAPSLKFCERCNACANQTKHDTGKNQLRASSWHPEGERAPASPPRHQSQDNHKSACVQLGPIQPPQARAARRRSRAKKPAQCHTRSCSERGRGSTPSAHRSSTEAQTSHKIACLQLGPTQLSVRRGATREPHPPRSGAKASPMQQQKVKRAWGADPCKTERWPSAQPEPRATGTTHCGPACPLDSVEGGEPGDNEHDLPEVLAGAK